jgi:pimeloyl-ACP methyl ester carboxylesterase
VSGERSFDEAIQEATARYGEGRFAEALDIVMAADPPAERAALRTVLEADLRSVMGDGAGALDVLEAGVARGEWWRPDPLLADSDLDPIRANPRFAAVVEVSGRRAALADAESEPLVRVLVPDSPNGSVLVALHGGSGNADEYATHWGAAVEAGWLVVVPQSPLASFSGGRAFNWPPPPAVSDQLAGDLATVRESHGVDRLVVAGTSQGARTALWCAAHGSPEPAVGVLAVAGAAALDDVASALPAAAERHLRAWFLTGDRDFALRAVVETKEAFVAAGVECRLTDVPGVGHGFPPDFDDRLPAILDFLAAS